MLLMAMRKALVRFFRFVFLGALTLAPLIITVWLGSVLFSAAARLGGVISRPLVGPDAGEGMMLWTVFEVIIALSVLAAVGALAKSVAGRQVGQMVNRLVDHVPVAKTVYRGVEKMLASFGSTGEDTRKVVLIEFPSPDMKAIGLVTRRFTAADTGQELAAVYVPTTPNPSSGYIEIVPVDRLVWLDWSAQDAIQFIMSGGVIGPDRIAYGRSGPDVAFEGRSAPPAPAVVSPPVKDRDGQAAVGVDGPAPDGPAPGKAVPRPAGVRSRRTAAVPRPLPGAAPKGPPGSG